MTVEAPHPTTTSDVQVETTPRSAAPSLRKAAFLASIWTVGGYGATQVIRLANNIVLSYFLMPSAFGVMALVNIFLQGLIMSSDIGVGPSVIQHHRGDDPVFLNTAWTIQALRGILLAFASILLSWPLAWFYQEPQLLQLLPVAACIPLLDGFTSTAIYTVQRTLDVHKLTMLEFISQIIGSVVMCAWGVVHPTVWALVAGTVASTLVKTAGSHMLVRGSGNRFAWNRDAAREIIAFGKWILLGTMIAFVALQIDRLVLGRLSTMATLGLYSVALAIAQLPYMILLRLTYHVQHPILSELQRRSSDELRRRFFHIRGIMLLIAISLTLGVYAVAPLFFRKVYDDNFMVAGNIAKLLCIATWGMILSETVTRVLMVKGDSRSLAVWNFVRVVVTLEATMAGYYLGDLTGFIIGVTIGILGGHVVLLMHMKWHKLSSIRQDLGYTILFAAGAALIEVMGWLGDRLFPDSGAYVATLIAAVVGGWACYKARRDLRQLSRI